MYTSCTNLRIVLWEILVLMSWFKFYFMIQDYNINCPFRKVASDGIEPNSNSKKIMLFSFFIQLSCQILSALCLIKMHTSNSTIFHSIMICFWCAFKHVKRIVCQFMQSVYVWCGEGGIYLSWMVSNFLWLHIICTPYKMPSLIFTRKKIFLIPPLPILKKILPPIYQSKMETQ